MLGNFVSISVYVSDINQIMDKKTASYGNAAITLTKLVAVNFLCLDTGRIYNIKFLKNTVLSSRYIIAGDDSWVEEWEVQTTQYKTGYKDILYNMGDTADILQ